MTGWDDLQERRQTCKVCGRPDKFNYKVPDSTWNDIVPVGYRRLVVCLACFDTFAYAGAQQYALTSLVFVGDQDVWEFEPRQIA